MSYQFLNKYNKHYGRDKTSIELCITRLMLLLEHVQQEWKYRKAIPEQEAESCPTRIDKKNILK